MDHSEVLEDVSSEIPQSNAYKLLCEDAGGKISKKALEKQRLTAENVKNTLNSAKLKAKLSYKNLDFWTEFGVKHPLHHLQKAVDATSSSVAEFQWLKPKNIEIVEIGDGKVRIFIEIDDKLFGNRDNLNLTYAAKRAHFICAAIRILNGKFGKVTFAPGGIHDDDFIFPDLQVDGVKIGFFNTNLAKSKRFVPNIGNLRPATIFGDQFEGSEIATPKYNQRILYSMQESRLFRLLEQTVSKNSTARLAINLIRQFFEIRHLEVFSSVILSARVARLVLLNKITEKQEILTVLRLVFRDFLSWSPDDIEFVQPEESLESDELIEEYSQHFDVNLLFDHLNLAANVSANQMTRMKKELSVCLPLLGQIYSFDGLFIDKLPFFAQFDHYARLHIENSQLTSHLLQELAPDSVDSRDVISAFVKSFELRIHQTMGERFEYMAMRVIGDQRSSWAPSDYAPESNQKTFAIGFRSTSMWKSPLTVGPAAQTEKAKEFRELWKGSSELRKFADTRICECVVWAEQASEKVPRAVVQFVLQKMFELPTTCVSWRDLDDEEIDSERQDTETVAKAFAELSATLRSLKGLPLMITNVHGISGYLRGTEPAYPSIFAASCPKTAQDDHVLPETDKIPLYSPTVTVHIKLEFSGRWGNDVEAIRRLTSSFYVKIAEKLREQKLCAVPTIDQLFVIQNGIVFKLVVVHDRILTILEEAVEQLKNSGATRIESSLPGIRLAAWRKKFIAEPLLQLQLQSFSTSHKFFGSTVQLFKRWLGAQLLSGHINDHIVELLVVAAITKKGSVEPQSTWCSFARVLQLISSHPWPARPLIVDFGTKTFDEETRARLEESFVKMRPILPPMVVLHEEDTIGNKFTRDHPQGMVLNRLVAVCREALVVMNTQTEGEKALDLRASLLRENLSVYDAVISLEPSAVVRKKAVLRRRAAKTAKLPVVELDPIDELVYQLNNHFHQVAMFFHNKYGGQSIGVLFKPTESEVPAKISRCSLHKSVSSTTLRLNTEEIVENILIMGQGIVSDVRIKQKS